MDSSSANLGDADADLARADRTFEFSSSVTPSVAVSEAVAEATGTDPREGPPLYDYVDTDALNALLTESTGDSEALFVTFEYDGHEVTVGGDGTVSVAPAASADS